MRGILVLLATALASCAQPAAKPANLPPPADYSGPEVQVTQYGQPLTLTGQHLAVRSKAPDTTLRTPENRDFALSQLRGKIVLISVVPELGTTICDRSTQRFDQVSQELDKNLVVIVVSGDDPDTQNLWLREHHLSRVRLLSDSVHGTFGPAYGMQIQETGRLARGVFILDRQGTLCYIEVERELAMDPNYDAAVAVVRKLMAEAGLRP